MVYGEIPAFLNKNKNYYTVMVINAAKAVPAAYIVPAMDVVEMGVINSILAVSTDNEGYEEETWL